ncbi:hypothetical protein TrVFT333_000926 [Trichoderma virens FT-333]|nr:hypothetical protein TrVFT333_000926 [Trichoderma virens FT-333]
MPNTGRPSRDCHLCRQRRVKCDLARPACQRCTKYGAQCPGYRDQQELVFRNADPTVVKKRKKRVPLPQSPSSSESSSSSSSSSSSDGGTFSAPNLTPNGDFVFTSSTDLVLANGVNCNALLPLTRPVFEHWTSHSIPILLDVYSNLDFIKNMYRDYTDDGPLLGGYLGKTLNLVSEALKTPEGAQRDDILATVWILTNYELLVGSLTRTEVLSPWHLHARGLYSILKARGTGPLYTSKGRTAFWPAYSMVQIQALGMGVAISHFIMKVCTVQARIFNLLRRRDFPAASKEYPELFARMKAAEQEFEDWVESNPIGNHVLEIYAISLYQSAIVKGYHVMQLLINFLTHYPPCPVPLEQLQEDRKFSIDAAQTAAQGILEGVPRVIGPLSSGQEKSPKMVFDALRVIWPLICVYVMTICRAEQRLAAEGLLFYIGRELGVRQALNTYPEGLTIPQEAKVPLGEVSLGV